MKAINNKVQLIGCVNKTEITLIGSNIKVAEILMNNLQTFRNSKGEKVTESLCYKCRAFGKLADIIEKYLTKGVEVAIEGTLIYSSISIKGRIKTDTHIQLNELLILTKRSIDI